MSSERRHQFSKADERTIRAALELAIQAEKDRLALRAWTEAEHMEEAKQACERSLARFERLLRKLVPPEPKPKPAPPEIDGAELFSPDYFRSKPPVPAEELKDCLCNPLEYDGPPRGRAALAERLISLSQPQP